MCTNKVLVFLAFATWVSGCVHSPKTTQSARFTLFKHPSISLELKGSRNKKLFGIKLPCKLTLGQVIFKSRPLELVPVELELRSAAGIGKSGLHSLYLAGRLSWSTRICHCLHLAVNYSTLLVFNASSGGQMGYLLGGVARLDL